ncbi:hypothetical protein [Anaerocolumna jejuensis]|uniref:hypothetical protein n=1 Tax=Anaerocolumna jejuensis TaxID=259063 RepID=UPI003F7BCA88
MKLRRISIIMVLVISMILSGCSKASNDKEDVNKDNGKETVNETTVTEKITPSAKEEFSVGKWNDDEFDSSWLNMKFKVDDNWSIASDEEISNLMGAGAEVLSELKGTNKEALEAAAKLKTIYDFVIYRQDDSTNSVMLLYENLTKTLGGTKYNEKDYLDVIKEQVPKQQYKLVDESKDKIAGKTFYSAKFSVNDGAAYQEYHCYKLDDYMVSLLVTYKPEEEKAMHSFIKNIEALK